MRPRRKEGGAAHATVGLRLINLANNHNTQQPQQQETAGEGDTGGLPRWLPLRGLGWRVEGAGQLPV